MFGCVALCPHFASPQSSGILPQHIKMALSQSQWVLQTKIFVVGHTYHTYNACFQDLSSMNPSTFPQRGPRQHCWAPRASCGGALCRVGRGNRGQSVGLWSCRWSCDYLACTLVTGKRFFQIDVDDVLEGSHMIWFTSTSSCLDVLIVDVGVVARIETGPQFCMGDLNPKSGFAEVHSVLKKPSSMSSPRRCAATNGRWSTRSLYLDLWHPLLSVPLSHILCWASVVEMSWVFSQFWCLGWYSIRAGTGEV